MEYSLDDGEWPIFAGCPRFREAEGELTWDYGKRRVAHLCVCAKVVILGALTWGSRQSIPPFTPYSQSGNFPPFSPRPPPPPVFLSSPLTSTLPPNLLIPFST